MLVMAAAAARATLSLDYTCKTAAVARTTWTRGLPWKQQSQHPQIGAPATLEAAVAASTTCTPRVYTGNGDQKIFYIFRLLFEARAHAGNGDWGNNNKCPVERTQSCAIPLTI